MTSQRVRRSSVPGVSSTGNAWARHGGRLVADASTPAPAPERPRGPLVSQGARSGSLPGPRVSPDALLRGRDGKGSRWQRLI